MTVRAPLSEVLSNIVTNPSAGTTKFVIADGGVEGNIDAAAALTILGTQGEKGAQGVQGTQGAQGTQGSQGTTGSQGTQGIDGAIGAQGIQGRQGTQGSQGTSGSQGIQGRQGTQGIQGRQGTQGTQGTGGAQGTSGINGVDGLSFTTATNVAGGVAGNILIQRGNSSTTFISTGNFGDLLQYTTNTATWVSTSTITVNKAINSDNVRVTTLTGLEGVRYPAMVNGGGGSYYTAGASTDLSFNTISRTLTSPNVAVTAVTNATSTLTGALIVAGGVGIARDLWVGGTITADKLIIQYTTVTSVSITTDDVTKINNVTVATSTTTGALQVLGGVGIGGSVYAGNIYSNGVLLTSGSGPSTGLIGGSAGQVPYQSGLSTTAFANAGSAGQLFVSSGPSIIGPSFKSTSTIIVGYAKNLTGGALGSIPYQASAGTTAMLALGTANQILRVNASTNGFEWATLSGLNAGTANTATNIAAGTAGQVPYQLSPGRTSFFGPGTAGQLLVSNGTNQPVYTNTSSIRVGYAANLTRGAAGSVPYQSANDTTVMLGVGAVNSVLTVASDGVSIAWATLADIGAGTANNLAGGSAGRIAYQTGVGQTGFTNVGTAGYVLASAGTGSPIWVSTSTFAGVQGRQGLQGITGSQGIQGIQGIAGNVQGIQGIQGIQGANGSGAQGVQGIAGTIQGIQGIQGSQGTAGSGSQGVQGIAGTIQGIQGIQGTTGSGAQGVQGIAGTIQGIQGIQGTTGNATQGTQGVQGIAGTIQGIQGIQGATGAGLQGVQGIAGTVQGIQGIQGITGAQGTQGVQGSQGIQGITGSQGIQGIQGIQGRSGTDANVQGIQGAQGTSGSQGIQGSGSQGIQGIIGAQGITGSQGVSGAGLGGATRISFNSNQDTTLLTTSANLGGIELTANGGDPSGVTTTAAFMAFHRPGAYASYFGLDTDNWFAVGGWSAGAATASFKAYNISAANNISASGEVTAWASDRRLKTNAKNITNALDKVVALNGIIYKWNDLAGTYGYNQQEELVGLFAQEVAKVLPQAIRPAPFDTNTDGTSKSGEYFLTIQYEKLVPLLVEAIKELNAKVEALEKRLT